MDADDDGFLDDLVQQQNREVLVESKLFFAIKTGEISLLQVSHNLFSSTECLLRVAIWNNKACQCTLGQ